MRVAWALMVVCGCGRIGFDLGTSGDAGAGGDAGSADGHGTGDGSADAAALACTPFDVITGLTTSSFGVSGLTWTGASYAMFRVDGLVTVSPAGVLGTLYQPTPAINTTSAGQNAIAWSGQRLAAVWTAAGGAIEFALFDASLVQIGSTVELWPRNADEPHVVWADTTFVVTWHETTGEQGIEEVTTDAIPQGSWQTSTSGAVVHAETVVATGGKYLVGNYEGGNATLVAWNRPLTGGATAPPIALGTSTTDYIQMANISTGAVIVMAGGTNPGALQELAGDGGATGGAIALPINATHDLQYATVVPDGTGALLAGVSSASPPEIVISHYDPSAGTFAAPTQVSTQVVSVYNPLSATRAEGRVLLALPYSDAGSISHTRLIQLCM